MQSNGSQTWNYLHSGTTDAPTNVTVSNPDGNYTLEAYQVWPIAGKGTPSSTSTLKTLKNIYPEPNTPQDMHNKFAIMEDVTNPSGSAIYMTSSNMDVPVDSAGSSDGGSLWQSGLVIKPAPSLPLDILNKYWNWNSNGDNQPSLYNAFRTYFQALLDTSTGSNINVYTISSDNAHSDFFTNIKQSQINGTFNYIETVPFDSTYQTNMQEGIDVFFFPCPISTDGTYPKASSKPKQIQ